MRLFLEGVHFQNVGCELFNIAPMAFHKLSQQTKGRGRIDGACSKLDSGVGNLCAFVVLLVYADFRSVEQRSQGHRITLSLR